VEKLLKQGHESGIEGQPDHAKPAEHNDAFEVDVFLDENMEKSLELKKDPLSIERQLKSIGRGA
jgi:hypothetical protein